MSPSHRRPQHDNCLAVREVLNRVGDKWSVLLIGLLGDGPRRFSELKRTVEGISQRSADAYATRARARRSSDANTLSIDPASR
jgi:hypothetical protein